MKLLKYTTESNYFGVHNITNADIKSGRLFLDYSKRNNYIYIHLNYKCNTYITHTHRESGVTRSSELHRCVVDALLSGGSTNGAVFL